MKYIKINNYSEANSAEHIVRFCKSTREVKRSYMDALRKFYRYQRISKEDCRCIGDYGSGYVELLKLPSSVKTKQDAMDYCDEPLICNQSFYTVSCVPIKKGNEWYVYHKVAHN